MSHLFGDARDLDVFQEATFLPAAKDAKIPIKAFTRATLKRRRKKLVKQAAGLAGSQGSPPD
jgi:hypothetical protein